MAVVNHLKTIDYILKKVSESSKCVELTGYSSETVNYFREYIDRVVRRYERDSDRVKKHNALKRA
jgi:hypothetical protein